MAQPVADHSIDDLLSSSGSWSATDTTPSEIEEALRDLIAERARIDRVDAPARVLNLIVIADREWKGEVANRLDRVATANPARTIVVALEPPRENLSAAVKLVNEPARASGDRGVFREAVTIDVGEQHLDHLDAIVLPVLAADVGTAIWSPHGHPEAVESLLSISDSVLIDSTDDPDPYAAIERATELAERVSVIDLAWLRPNPWRERIAAAFNPPVWRDALGDISSVEVRTGPGSNVAALLLVGWLGSRLGWQPGTVDLADPDRPRGTAVSAGRTIDLCVMLDRTMTVPGLSGVTIETAGGIRFALDRGAGGLTACRSANGHDSRWTVLGASRGEDGILARGLTHALLPDPIYLPALAATRAMLRRDETDAVTA